MKPHTRTPQPAESGTPNVSSTKLFRAFSNERRQYALAYLAQQPAAIHINDLAEYIAITEGEPSYDWYERILTDLNHRHLPQLADLGLVRYDTDEERVELIVNRRVIAPYLRLTEHET